MHSTFRPAGSSGRSVIAAIAAFSFICFGAHGASAEPASDSTFTPDAPPAAIEPAPPRGADGAQFPSGAPPAGSSITNPAISVIGWFQAAAGNDPTAAEHAFELHEAELAFQAAVDPFTRADFFMAATPSGLDLEEGYITWLALPFSTQAKVGKFRADFGKFNRTHVPETPFADRPLSAAVFLGEEGLVTTGLSLSTLIPNPFGLYWDATANLGNLPEADTQPVFEADTRSDLLTLGRTSVFVPAGAAADFNFGVSYANGSNRATARETEGNRAQLGTADVTFRWKNPRRSIYRSLVAQAEFTGLAGSRTGAERYTGWFGYALYQFARQWKLGGRYDWTETPGVHENSTGALALLQYQPSEFSTMSVQFRRVWEPGDQSRDAAFFKWTFNIGPHGAHPY